MSWSTTFQSFWDGATASWVFTSTLGTLKCLAQGHYMAVVGFKPWTSPSRVQSSTTEPPQPAVLTVSVPVHCLSCHLGLFLAIFSNHISAFVGPCCSKHCKSVSLKDQIKMSTCSVNANYVSKIQLFSTKNKIDFVVFSL